jgi:hypothetical protein
MFYKTSYTTKEVNRTEPFPSVSVPCRDKHSSLFIHIVGGEDRKEFIVSAATVCPPIQARKPRRRQGTRCSDNILACG